MAEAHEWRSETVSEWERSGTYRTLGGWETFTMDIGPLRREEHEPLVVLHGFPTSSFDFHLVAEKLAANRRVCLLDMIGYGLSAKPDLSYTIDLQAEVVQSFVTELGLSTLSLLTHDMGDTVGGELLARNQEGRWPVEIARRVVTNGSIYIEMAHLSDGQNFLLALPDERLSDKVAADRATLTSGLAATFSRHSAVDETELAAAWELISHRGGHLLLPRTIRYIEERRRYQDRYTGAIESHPSPLGVLWGTDDPIAVADMATRLHRTRPDSQLVWLHDVGHYLMLEAPDEFLAALAVALG